MTSRLVLRGLKALAFLLAGLAFLQYASAQTARPAITGISHMCVYASAATASERFYVHDLGAKKGTDPQDASGVRYYFSATQFVEVLPLPAKPTLSRMNCVAFETADAAALHEYLRGHAVTGLGEVQRGSDGSQWFKAHDPEGNLVQFVQSESGEASREEISAGARPISTHLIHVGYMVRSRSAEDKFYHELLGFRPYWYGAMQPGKVDWISLQVPDGHDWMEYMMTGDGSDSPVEPDALQLGGMNHFSLGVANMETAMTTLIGEDRVGPRHNGPQMGKDGKWQANLYDPDGTRVELMEFQPVIAPCCSKFTAESPSR